MTPDNLVPQAKGPLAGLNICGYLRDESGWGAAARRYTRALRALGIPLALNDISALSTNRSADQTLTQFESAFPYSTNLVCVDPTQHFAVLSELGAEYFQGRYNIGAWAWELPRFPAKWMDRLAYYDEIWVMTAFVADALAPVAPIPVIRIPPVLTVRQEGSREQGRRRLGLSGDDFVLLFIFDFHSHLARKNPLAVIDAFKLAFGSGDRARLVVKSVNGESDPQGLGAMYESASGYPILICDGYWTGQEIQDLYAGCDAYVSLHRSEGMGLTIADAMALGKPVIATGWSGNMDFMNVSNSYPVRYDLVEITENVGPYRAGEVWAEPSVEHAAELMRHVFGQREEGRARGEAARRDIETNYSEGKIAALIHQRLEAIDLRRRGQAFRQQAWAAFFDYQRLAGQIRAVVRRIVPQGATIIVVSKGDDELLKLDGRQGWHFPQTEDGVYVGYHPADSAAAIKHLEELRGRGGEYLLFPQPAFWWLDYYLDFRNHLDKRYSCIWRDERCIIYELSA